MRISDRIQLCGVLALLACVCGACVSRAPERAPASARSVDEKPAAERPLPDACALLTEEEIRVLAGLSLTPRLIAERRAERLVLSRCAWETDADNWRRSIEIALQWTAADSPVWMQARIMERVHGMRREGEMASGAVVLSEGGLIHLLVDPHIRITAFASGFGPPEDSRPLARAAAERAAQRLAALR